MRCEVCGHEKIPLFFSLVCDYCDTLKATGAMDRGWIVWRNRPIGSSEYVFKSADDAERWRRACGLADHPIRPVVSPRRFVWKRSQGSVKDIEVADRLYEIYADSDTAAGPDRAFFEG